MYPDFQYLLQSIFGVEMPEWLSVIKTFGFLVALAFLAAAWTISQELKRKEKEGLLSPEYTTIEVGKPATAMELFWSALLGFLLGFKFGGIFGNAAEIAPNPMGYLFSANGNFLIGIAGALLMGISKYYEKKKQQLPEPETRKVLVHPYQLVTEIAMIAAIAGFAGAKIFNALETWDDFVANPIDSLISSSGLTFYGGLILATISLYYYARRHGIPFKHLCDAAAPGLILAYGIGRLGCQTAGDGDWGIFNSAYATQADGTLIAVAKDSYMQHLHSAAQYFTANFGSLSTVPHIYAPAPSWLPDWMFAMNYPHNVNSEGVQIMGCTGSYCAVLPMGVFPTPLYESFVCICIFGILWAVRRKLIRPWQMFGLYLIFNGIERFFVEKIRVNYKYDLGFIHPTQAEIISVVLVLLGILLLVAVRKPKTVLA